MTVVIKREELPMQPSAIACTVSGAGVPSVSVDIQAVHASTTISAPHWWRNLTTSAVAISKISEGGVDIRATNSSTTVAVVPSSQLGRKLLHTLVCA